MLRMPSIVSFIESVLRKDVSTYDIKPSKNILVQNTTKPFGVGT
jgi:hypothetical protein